MINNPFSGYGSPVSPDDFCGRHYIVRSILGRISRGEHTSIVGERRIGKTSLLLYLRSELAAKKFGLQTDNFIFVYIDFLEFYERYGEPDRRKFWLFVMENMRGPSSGKPWLSFLEQLIMKLRSESSNNPYLEVLELLRIIQMYGVRPVLLMDEFEAIARSEQLNSQFFDGLRPLYSHLVFIISTRNYLSLVRKQEVFGSPFFNIFSTTALNEFTESEFVEWMGSRLSNSPIAFDQSAVDLITDLSGRHPFFATIAAHHVFYAYLDYGSRLDKTNIREIKERFYTDSKPNFDDYWSYCSDGEKINIALLAMHPNDKRIDVDIEEVRSLRMRSLISKEYRVFSSMFERYIQKEVFSPIPQTFDEFRQKKLADMPEARLKAVGTGIKDFIVKINEKYQLKFWEYIMANPQLMETFIHKVIS
jgi:eukaryotic-like serine/threonine-protein kinase